MDLNHIMALISQSATPVEFIIPPDLHFVLEVQSVGAETTSDF